MQDWRSQLRRAAAAVSLPIALLAAGSVRAETAPTVILISLDGTRPVDLEGADLPHFTALRKRGAWAARLTPVFPTNTFPNHATLVTGVVPDVHGLVNNDFVDPERGEFHKAADPTWLLAEPLWSIAAQHGVTSASYYWVGSEGPWRSGRGPRYWLPFDDGTPDKKKVKQILAWLAGPEPRPRLVTAWFHGADRQGHSRGPGMPATRKALAIDDAAIGELVAGLDARGAFAHTTLLIVSDHGMAPVQRRVDLAAALRTAGVEAEVIGAGGMATVVLPKDRYVELIDRAVGVARSLGLEAWPREEAPAGLRTGNPRFGDMVVMAPVGIAIQSGRLMQLKGAHGYHPQEPAMGALLLAVGRGAPAGAQLGELSSLDVAPTVLRLLELPIPDTMQGRPIAGLLPGTPAGATAAKETH
jgi:predicted AlkP superfamily pyrophosphatase or phosphodiesterase